MNLEIGAVHSKATTASVMAGSVAEHVAALMVFGGIETVSSEIVANGYATSMRTSIAYFTEAPQQIRNVGAFIKDDLARILAVANINRVIVKPTKAERIDMREGWSNAINDANTANGGSGADTGDDDEVDEGA